MAGAVLPCGVSSTSETGDRPRHNIKFIATRLVSRLFSMGEILPYMTTGRRVIKCRETLR